MAARLAEASDLPNVTIRVVPFVAGFSPGMLTGPFIILRFPPANGGGAPEPPTVYSDLFSGALYLDKPHEVDRYDHVFQEMQEQSTTETSSTELFLKTAKELRHEHP